MPCAIHHGMITTMGIDDWWAKLPQETREWLIAHNGEPLPDNVASTVRDAGTPFDHAAWWDDSGTTITFADRAIDWIEAVANDEDPTAL